MNTKTIAQFDDVDTDVLITVIVGAGGWADVLSGLLGGFAPSPTVDQLNGKWPVRNPPKACSPYGTGGTPNSCNGF